MPVKQEHGPILNQVGPNEACSFDLHFSSEVINTDFNRARAVIEVTPRARLVVAENGDLIFQDLDVADASFRDSFLQSEYRERHRHKLLALPDDSIIYNIHEAMIDPDSRKKSYSVEDLVFLTRLESRTLEEERRLSKYLQKLDQEVAPVLLAAFLGFFGQIAGRGEGHGDVKVFGHTRFQSTDPANIQVKILHPFSEFLIPLKRTEAIKNLTENIKNTSNGGILFIPTNGVAPEACHDLKRDFCRLGLDPIQVVFLNSQLLVENGFASFQENNSGKKPGIRVVHNDVGNRKLPYAAKMVLSGSLDRIHSDPELSEMLSSESKARIKELESYLQRNYQLAHTFNS